jgi:putative acetyltransferase
VQLPAINQDTFRCMEIHIRSSCIQELPDLITLQTLSLKTFYSNHYESEQVTALIESQTKARKLVDETILVAEVNQQVVGFVSLSHATWHLNALYVHPDWIRRGIGKQLLASAEEVAAQRRYRVLRVITSMTAVSFYQSQGYHIQRPFDLRTLSGAHIPCQLLEKRLLSPDPVLVWLHRHRLIILLLLGLCLGISAYYSEKQRIQHQFNSPTHNVEPLSL